MVGWQHGSKGSSSSSSRRQRAAPTSAPAPKRVAPAQRLRDDMPLQLGALGRLAGGSGAIGTQVKHLKRGVVGGALAGGYQ